MLKLPRLFKADFSLSAR